MRALYFLILVLDCLFPQVQASGLFWAAPGKITRFESTLIVPAKPIHFMEDAQRQYIWPGLEPANGATVLQNVLMNDTGDWVMWPEYCCDPNEKLSSSIPLNPGDALTSIYALDKTSGQWAVSTSLEREGIETWNGALTFIPQNYPLQNAFQLAFLVIELQDGASWDWGQTTWKNIMIEVETQNTTWCTYPREDPHNSTWSVTEPMSASSGGVSACCIAEISMAGP